MDKNGLSQSIDLNKFQDSGGITLSKMNIGLWIVANRRRFFWGFIIFLIVLSAIFYGYTLYNYVDYLFFGGQKERAAIEELTKTPSISESQRIQSQAKPIENSAAQFFISSGRYDFLVKLNNPNDKFFVNFDYCFTDAGKDIACSKSFLLPTENRYLASFNNELTGLAQLGFRIYNLKWDRINLHTYPDWANFYATHINFSSSDVDFKTAQESGLSEKLSFNTLDFKISNNSAYNFWDAPFLIVMFNGQTPAAINHYSVNNFLSGEVRPVKITWTDTVTSVERLEIFPEINILDDTVFMKYK